MNIKTKLLIAAASVFLVCNLVLAEIENDIENAKTSGDFSISDVGGKIGKMAFSIQGNVRMVYLYKSVPAKPYVKVLKTPKGINVLRDAPHDHLHHHGLMFGLKIDETDFWAEKKNCGKQIHNKHKILTNIELDTKNTSLKFDKKNSENFITEDIDWIEPSKKIILHEKRKLSVKQPGNATILTWNSKLRPPENVKQVKIGGSHYFGLGMRFVKSMDNNGTFINAAGKEGKIFRGTERLVSGKWCAYQSAVDGKDVTVAMFDHPKNFRPVTWFTMLKPFSYLSATLRYHEKPFVLKAKDELNLKYGVVVWDGKQNKEVIEKAWIKWAKAVKTDKEKQ